MLQPLGKSFIVIASGIAMAAVWQFGFDFIYTLVDQLFNGFEDSADVITTVLFAQSFLMGAIPALLIVYIYESKVAHCVVILLTSIIIFLLLMEVLIAGWYAIIGLILATSAWFFIVGALLGCISAGLLKRIV